MISNGSLGNCELTCLVKMYEHDYASYKKTVLFNYIDQLFRSYLCNTVSSIQNRFISFSPLQLFSYIGSYSDTITALHII